MAKSKPLTIGVLVAALEELKTVAANTDDTEVVFSCNDTVFKLGAVELESSVEVSAERGDLKPPIRTEHIVFKLG